ncbi:hypothetical protein C8A00DRAFT_18368 [Chaetomidium leptoderma]|uniref:Uncharacterized protein n=1 Tax=Chaetomidium leptoderma TaxID=669021 RepID=A0AAN6ZV66_9PEZI|nr:hypothetical protein C8A00DRAFT_18368 [Chaetomidium leptoderma]
MVLLHTSIIHALLAVTSTWSGRVAAGPARSLAARHFGNNKQAISSPGTDRVRRDTPTGPGPVILQPLRITRQGNSKRDRRTALELKGEETLYWAGEDGTVARLRIETPDETENVVNLELIDDMVRQVTCPSTDSGTLKLQFAEEADFNDAEDIWQWVNQAADNRFLLLVGAGACGWNTERILYNVTGLVYNDEAETAMLQVQQTTWKQAAHTFDLTVGHAAVPPAARHRRHPGILDKITHKIEDAANQAVDKIEDAANQVIDKVEDAANQAADKAADIAHTIATGTTKAVSNAISNLTPHTNNNNNNNPLSAAGLSLSPAFTIPLTTNLTAPNQPLTFTLPAPAPPLAFSATCLACHTSGSLTVQAHFSARWFKLTAASIEVSLPENLTATAILALTLKGDVLEPIVAQSLPLFELAPGGVAIPGIITLGPTVGVSVGMEVGAVKGAVGVTLGGTAVVEGGSVARLDFLKERGDGGEVKKGWGVEFRREEFRADASVETRAAVFLRAAVGVEVSVFETGFAAELRADAPTLSATLKAVTSSNCTVCGEYQNGLQGSLNFGTSIGASLTKKVAGTETPLWSLNFAEAHTPAIAGFCQGFGLQGQECQAAA